MWKDSRRSAVKILSPFTCLAIMRKRGSPEALPQNQDADIHIRPSGMFLYSHFRNLCISRWQEPQEPPAISKKRRGQLSLPELVDAQILANAGQQPASGTQSSAPLPAAPIPAGPAANPSPAAFEGEEAQRDILGTCIATRGSKHVTGLCSRHR